MTKIKEFFGAVGRWLRDNWLPLLLVVAVVALFAKGCERSQAYDSLFEQYQTQSEDHQRQITELMTLREREREELNRQLQAYLENMQRIEREYKEEIARISTRTETRRVTIVREYERDPMTLTATTRDMFGIPIEE